MELIIEREAGRDRIAAVLRAFDHEFPRSLTSRVGDLTTYAQKLADHGVVYGGHIDSELVGFVAFYANDTATATAFLAQLVVSSAVRGQGVGGRLLEHCLRAARDAGMRAMRLEVDRANRRAIAFYESVGFSVGESASSDSVYMLRADL